MTPSQHASGARRRQTERKPWLVGVLRTIRYLSMLCIARLPFLIPIYYSLCGAFLSEQREVLTGRIAYLSARDRASGLPEYLLIRNTHRIEKGLCAAPRRSFFAESYIGETVEALERMVNALTTGEVSKDYGDTIAWALDVLTEYFLVTHGSRAIGDCRGRFEQIRRVLGHEFGGRCPHVRGEPSQLMSYDALLDLAKQRRSVRSYRPDAVPRQAIDRAMSVAAQSPSACNRQAFRFLIYDDPCDVQALHALSPGIDGPPERIPCLVVIVGNRAAYPDVHDRHILYIDIGLAVMAFQYALETLGLASTCINWPCGNQRDKAMRRFTKIAEYETIAMLLTVGYPDPEGLVPFSQKKSLSLLRQYNDT